MSYHPGRITGPVAPQSSALSPDEIEQKLRRIQKESRCSRSTAIGVLVDREPHLMAALRESYGGAGATLRDTIDGAVH